MGKYNRSRDQTIKGRSEVVLNSAWEANNGSMATRNGQIIYLPFAYGLSGTISERSPGCHQSSYFVCPM